MKLFAILIACAPYASAQILTKVQDYPRLSFGVTIQEAGVTKSISSLWDRISDSPTRVTTGLAAKWPDLSRSKIVAEESIDFEPPTVDYQALFSALQSAVNAHRLYPTTINKEVPGAVGGTAEIRVHAHSTSVTILVDGRVDPQGFHRAKALFLELEKCTSEDQRKLLEKGLSFGK